MTATHTFTYNRTHTAAYVSDNILNVLRDIVREGGLDPTQLMDYWASSTGNAVRTWLSTGDLTQVTIEFFAPGSNVAAGRWDFPVNYDGSGTDDDMWVSKQNILRALAKTQKPPANAKYEIILSTKPGRPDVAGMSSTQFRSTAGLVSRSAGLAIATPDIMAEAKYWRAV